MRAIVQTALGDLKSLRVVERRKPRPGPTQVLIRMRAAALNHRDLTYLRNDYAGYGADTFLQPVVPLSDGVGIVEETGAKVVGLAAGDRVCTVFNQAWMYGPLRPELMLSGLMPGPNFEGVLQEYICVEESGVVPAPAHLTDAEAATLPCSGLTAWSSLKATKAQAGDAILINGTGGVAIAALQLAKAMDARVYLASSSPWKRERALQHGADATFDNQDLPALVAAVADATGGLGVDIVIEAGGGRTMNAGLQCLKLEGRMALMGLLSGADADLHLPLLTVARRSIIGINVGNREDFSDMNAFVTKHHVRPLLDRVYPFEHAQEAFVDYQAKSLFSKFAIAISEV